MAHMAARFCNLPEGFDRWELADNGGETVRDVHEKREEEEEEDA